MKNNYNKSQKYFFVFLGTSFLKTFEGKFVSLEEKLYGVFKIGKGHLECRTDFKPDSFNEIPVNVPTSEDYPIVEQPTLAECMSSKMFIFTTKEKVNEMLPKLVKSNLEYLQHKAEELRNEYMEIVDNCTTIEQTLEDVLKGKFNI